MLTASCDGYHKFGSMGEHMVVTLMNGENVERSVGLVPLRITVMVTLRELRPLAGKSPKQVGGWVLDLNLKNCGPFHTCMNHSTLA